MRIGIIGVGMVGGAIKSAAEARNLNIGLYDKYKKIGAMQDALNSEVVFVCVPTPTNDGLQDISILKNVLADIKSESYKGVVVIKSTVLPGTVEYLSKTLETLRLAHNPEFLVEATASSDFASQEKYLVSCAAADAETIARAYDLLTPDAEGIFYTDYKITETAKYFHNCFLATKVAFANEFYMYCQDHGVDYNTMIEAAKSQGKVGTSHLRVPGPDGKFGFGGACFPKDTLALVNHDYSHFDILRAAIKSNRVVRNAEG